MAGFHRLTFRLFMAIFILAGMSLLLFALATDSRAAGPQADSQTDSYPSALPGISESVAENAAILISGILTDTINIYFPFIVRDSPKVCGTISTDTVWTADEGPYQIYCYTYIEAGATLTIEAGVTVLFHNREDKIVVDGALRAEGTEQNPIRFQPESGKTPGSWASIDFGIGSSGVLNHAILESGGNIFGHAMLSINSDDVQVLNSIIQTSGEIGIEVRYASPVINASQFLSNTFLSGISILGGNPTIQNSIFRGNKSKGLTQGGGLRISAGDPLILNNFFYDNSAMYGGGLWIASGNAVVRNNLVISNTASSGGGISVAGGAPRLDYNDVWNNAGGDYFGVVPGAHEIHADPLLVDPANGDFHLSTGSPCINTGDPNNYPSTDFEGDPRPMGLAPDIGVDEYY